VGMAGYAATARITHVAPRRVAHDPPVEIARVDLVDVGELAVEELSGRPFLASLTDAWDDAREIWRQGMDVLRDPRIY
jgi:hypothetical protein